MSKQNVDVNDLIEQMACIKLLDDLDFRNADKAKRELMKVNSKGEIKEQVEQLSKDIKSFIPDGMNLPTSVEFAVATQMLNQIDRNPEVPISQINIDNKSVLNALNLDIAYDEDRMDLEDVAVAAAVGYALSDNDGKQNEINEIPSEISEARDKLFNDFSSRVHEEEASFEEQSAMIGFSYGAGMDTGAELGLKLGDLEFSDQCEIIKIVKDYLKFGDKKMADFYCQRYDITVDDLENPEYESFDHLMDTVSPEEDRVMYEINKLAAPIRMFADYTDRISPELCEKEFEILKEKISASEYPVDAIFKAIMDSKKLSQNKEIYARFIDLGIEMFNDPNVNVDNDGWLLSYMVDAVKECKRAGMEKDAKSIAETINKGLNKDGITIPYEKMLEINTSEFQEYISDEYRRSQTASECIKSYADEKGLDYKVDRTRNLGNMLDIAKKTDREPYLSDLKLMEDFKIGIARAYKEGGDEAAHQCFKDFVGIYSQNVQEEMRIFVQSGAYREIDTREPKKVEQINPVERKRQALEKMMNTITNGKGLKRAEEVIEELITRYPDKDIAIGAALSFLETQKENNPQFMSADSREARESVFEAIVLTGIEEADFYKRMQELDRATSKIVVNRVLGQINDSRASINKVLGAVQLLGMDLNERTEPIVEDKSLGFLNPDETTLPSAKLLPEDNGDERDDF